jgi:hypothetical protein
MRGTGRGHSDAVDALAPPLRISRDRRMEVEPFKSYFSKKGWALERRCWALIFFEITPLFSEHS